MIFLAEDGSKPSSALRRQKNLGARLDGAEFARVREQVRKYYDAHFHLLDIGIALPLSSGVASETSPSLLQRFTMPDVIVRDTIFRGAARPTEQTKPLEFCRT